MSVALRWDPAKQLLKWLISMFLPRLPQLIQSQNIPLKVRSHTLPSIADCHPHRTRKFFDRTLQRGPQFGQSSRQGVEWLAQPWDMDRHGCTQAVRYMSPSPMHITFYGCFLLWAQHFTPLKLLYVVLAHGCRQAYHWQHRETETWALDKMTCSLSSWRLSFNITVCGVEYCAHQSPITSIELQYKKLHSFE